MPVITSDEFTDALCEWQGYTGRKRRLAAQVVSVLELWAAQRVGLMEYCRIMGSVEAKRRRESMLTDARQHVRAAVGPVVWWLCWLLIRTVITRWFEWRLRPNHDGGFGAGQMAAIVAGPDSDDQHAGGE